MRAQDSGLATARGLGTAVDPALPRPPREGGIVAKHDLWHACATIFVMAGKHPEYVQELLGHASINITLDTYSHVIEGMDGGLGDAMDEAP